MRVAVETWHGRRVMDLVDALIPKEPRDGQIEQAQATADAAALAVARLAAKLVEKGLFTLDEATEVCGIYDDITPA